jgi:hypothetical protein
VLRRHGLSRLADTDRATGVPVRYCREHPGELAHLDVKKLGRVPPGGGHRKLGRAQGRRHRAAVGYEYVHSLVDDCFRVAYSAVYDDQGGQTSAWFLAEAATFFAEQGVRLQRVLHDNAKAYTDSVVFAETAARLGIRLTRTPLPAPDQWQARTLQRHVGHRVGLRRLYRSNAERRRALGRFLDFYNHRRPPYRARRAHAHGGLGQQR